MTCPSGLLSFLCWRNFPPLIRREAQLEKEYNVGGVFFPITAGKKKKAPRSVLGPAVLPAKVLLASQVI